MHVMGRTPGGEETRSHVLVSSSATISLDPDKKSVKDDRKTIMTRRVEIRWAMMPTRKGRNHHMRGRRHIRRRKVRGSIRNMRATRIMKVKRSEVCGDFEDEGEELGVRRVAVGNVERRQGWGVHEDH
jgi:hypothetical protein